MDFIHLHVHSQFSILNSTCSIQTLVDLAKKNKMSSLAITDNGNLFGAIDFYCACQSAAIKPIIGCQLYVAFNDRFEKQKTHYKPGYPILLLAKNYDGYKNLCKLSSLGYLEGFYHYPRIDLKLLEQYSSDLICLMGGLSSVVGSIFIDFKNEQLASDTARRYKELFKDDFYFKLARYSVESSATIAEGWLLQEHKNYIKKEKELEAFILKLSKKLSIEYVATNEVHYADKVDWLSHEIMLNIKAGRCRTITQGAGDRTLNPKRKTMLAYDYYFKSTEAMNTIFSDLPQALANSITIADKCAVQMAFDKRHYPKFDPPTTETVDEYLYRICKKNIATRYPPHVVEKLFPKGDGLDQIHKRLDYEFKTISSKKLTDYLLMVADFITWAKGQNIPVGPGRGSGSGSIICYLLQITDIDPIRFALFFERFLNPERPSYPDIDVDICMERRHEVINYMSDTYGSDKVAQIITFSTMKARLAIKDVGRTLGLSLAKVNQLVKWIDASSKSSLQEAMEASLDIKNALEADALMKTVYDTSIKLEGAVRGTSIHAAGLIVSNDPIMEHVPLCIAKDSDMAVTQFCMKPVEKAGMLKVDFLGLKTLTIIQKTVDSIALSHKKNIDWTDLPLDDKKTFDLISVGKTLGIFQLEGTGMRDMVTKLKMNHFSEIIAAIALYRPGPMAMIPSFIARKHKEEEITVDHPLMKDILEGTYGLIVYQEQVIQIAQKLAGYSAGQADLFRKAMGKKDLAEMARQRSKFIEGAKKNSIPEDVATLIFDKIEKFASYAFNKAHAAAYAYITYTTAYLKAHYPKDFLTAFMTIAKDDLKKITKFIKEAASLDIKVFLPDINRATASFSTHKDGIFFGLGGIKGVGENVVQAILKEREKKGSFASFHDVVNRLAIHINKKTFSTLIQAGSFDSFSWTRDQMIHELSLLYDDALRHHKEQQQGTILFDFVKPTYNKPQLTTTTTFIEQLFTEKELLGLYLSGSPLEEYKDVLQKLPLESIAHAVDKKLEYTLAAVVVEGITFKTSQNGMRYGRLNIINDNEPWELMAFSNVCGQFEDLLKENKLLLFVVKIDYGYRVGLQVLHIWDIQTAPATDAVMRIFKNLKKSSYDNKKKSQKDMKKIEIAIDADIIELTDIVALKKLFLQATGGDELVVVFQVRGNVIGTVTPAFRVDYEKIKSITEKKGILKLSLL